MPGLLSESSPLGAGAHCVTPLSWFRSQSVVIVNGDSYTDVDLGEFVGDCRDAKANASLVVVFADGRGDCGSVLLAGDGKLVGFQEKRGPFRASYNNAGIYPVSQQLLHEIPPGLEVSLEQELLPQWLRQGNYIKGPSAGVGVSISALRRRYRYAQDLLPHAEIRVDKPQRRTGD